MFSYQTVVLKQFCVLPLVSNQIACTICRLQQLIHRLKNLQNWA